MRAGISERACKGLAELEVQKELVGKAELIKNADASLVNGFGINAAYDKLEASLRSLIRG